MPPHMGRLFSVWAFAAELIFSFNFLLTYRLELVIVEFNVIFFQIKRDLKKFKEE